MNSDGNFDGKFWEMMGKKEAGKDFPVSPPPEGRGKWENRSWEFPSTKSTGKRETDEQLRRKLSTDPRFALWAARDTAAPDLGPLADPVYPDVEKRQAEHNELRRVAAVSALRNGGKHLSPQEAAKNRVWAGLDPLAGHRHGGGSDDAV